MSLAAEDDRPAGDEPPRVWRHLTILATLGEDAAGTVYRAYDRTRQGDVALRLLRPAASAAIASKAVEDARRKMRARHPNLAAVYGASEADGRVGVWMELVKGETLADLVKTHGTLSPREAARIGLALCGALTAVHDAGLLHGDVRPHKVMRAESDGASERIVLLNFGMEPVLDDPGTGAHESADDEKASALLYQPPEILDGRARTPSADIYGLGVLLFHLVTNAYPVTGRTRAEIQRAHQSGQRRSLKELRPQLPKDFVHAVERSLAPNLLDRYQTIGAVEVTLARYLGPDKSRRGWLSLPWSRAAAVVLVLMLAGAAGFAYRRVRVRNTATDSSSVAGGTTAVASGEGWGIGGTPYAISATLYRESGGLGRLSPGVTLTPGDELSIEVTASAPTYVYVVDENDRGEVDLLYPLPGQRIANPLPAGTTSRLAGLTATGEREHVLLFASPVRLSALEQLLPPRDASHAGARVRVPDASIEQLRTAGQSATNPTSAPHTTLVSRFPNPLLENAETVRGVWVRRITLDKRAR